jgi:uncharacterized membrane protein YesL
VAGFLGFGSNKPGKGVKKETVEKKRFFQFFDIFFRKFTQLIKLNLLYLLFCIPIVTVGPATAALMKICLCYTQGKPVFLFSDFWDAFKSNFKQGFFAGILSILIAYVLYKSLLFHYAQTFLNGLYWIPLILTILLAVVFIFASCYVYIMMVSINVSFFALIKNSVLMAVIGAKSNWFTMFFGALVLLPSLLFFPFSIPVLLLLTFSLTGLIIAFNSFQYVYTYLIKPYYEQNGLENPYEVDYSEDAIFQDGTE